MPITQEDLAPFINGIPQAPPTAPTNYYSGGAATSGGAYTRPAPNMPLGGSSPGSALDVASGGVSGLLDSLGIGMGSFFGSKPAWKPFLGSDGRYYYTSPTSRNPVPVAGVPGASLAPNRQYQRTASNTQALTDLLPYLTQAISGASQQGAIGDYNTSAITSPLYAQLMTSLYNTYGPQLNSIGNEIQTRNAMASANRDLGVLQGPGQDLVNQAYQSAQTFDKPWYDTRATTANRLSDLMGSINLSGGLSDTERQEIAKGNALDASRRGVGNAPSATEAAGNAMTYGQAGYQRQQQAKSNLSQAIQSAAAFMPTAKSGVDVFQVATGRSSTPNPGNALFPGVNQTNSNASYGLAGSTLGNMNQAQMNQDTINSQKKDWLDQFNQFAGGLSSIMGSVGGAAGAMCWVAREVYGLHNPKWKVFRNWLRKESPNWLFNTYLKYGESFASYIANKPKVKFIINKLMNFALKGYSNV